LLSGALDHRRIVPHYSSPGHPAQVSATPPELIGSETREQLLVVPQRQLEDFDDPDWEILARKLRGSSRLEAQGEPQDWLTLCDEVHGMPAYSKFYRDGELGEEPCQVVGYDGEKRMFRIEWDSNGKSKWVTR